VSKSRVTWTTSTLILVFLGLSVLDLGPVYATDRQTSDANQSLMPATIWGGSIIMSIMIIVIVIFAVITTTTTTTKMMYVLV